MILGQKEKLRLAKEKLESVFTKQPDVFIILGSGLGSFTEHLTDSISVPYKEIPNFLTSTVPGHVGQLVAGNIENNYVVAMQGRFHYYEGYKLQDVTFPVRVLSSLGAKNLVLTNAAGAINSEFTPGDLMLITDHLNLLGDNPLIGPNDETIGPRFPDMNNLYDRNLQKLAVKTAKKLDITLHRGVYAAMSGPSYETPSEVRMLRSFGADAVGMSTVPEAIVGKYCGLRVLGISCLSNYAAGISRGVLTHQECLVNVDKANAYFSKLLLDIVKKM